MEMVPLITRGKVGEGMGAGLSAFGRASGLGVVVKGMAAALLNGELETPQRERRIAKLTRRFLHDSQALWTPRDARLVG